MTYRSRSARSLRAAIQIQVSAVALCVGGAARAQDGTVGKTAPTVAAGDPSSSTTPVPVEASTGQTTFPSAAQTIDPADIVVTAQKRSESLQKVPLAVSAFTGATLVDRGIRDLPQIATLVPSVNIAQRFGFGVVTIRGIGFDQLTAGAEASVAIHQDGVYMARPTTALSGFYDVERIEIARGPQGTLYGRNSTGGAVNIISRKPTADPSGYVDVSYGNYNALSAEGALSGPIAGDVLLARFAFKLDEHDGWGRNVATGNEVDNLSTRAARLTLLFQPSDRFSVTATGDVYRENDRANVLHFGGYYVPCPPPTGPFGCGTSFGGKFAADIRDVDHNIDPENVRTVYGTSATLDYRLSDAITLRDVIGYRHTRTRQVSDGDGTNFFLFNVGRRENSRAFSNEVQLLGDMSRFKWILGGYYFRDKTDAFGGGPFGPTTGRDVITQSGVLTTEAYAAFGQGTVEAADWLSLTAGGRYSEEKKSLFDDRFYGGVAKPFPFAGLTREISFHSFTPKFGVELKPTKSLLVFGNVQKGFKSGGFAPGAEAPPFEPETLWSYEAGLKLTTNGNRFNLTGFHYDYNNVQVGRVVGLATLITNAAKASLTGIELETDVGIVGELRADLSGSYIDGHYTEYTTVDPNRPALGALDLSDNSLSALSKFSFNAGLQNSWFIPGGRITLRGEAFHASRFFFSPFNVPDFSQPSYELYNAFLTYSGDNHWTGSLFVRNITDKTVVGSGYLASPAAGSPQNIALQPPRTYGIRIGYKF